MPGPLDGVKIVDLSAMISGPLATQILGDQGAEIIKIEPLGGDGTRRFGAMRNGFGAMYTVINRNKRSLAIDLKSDAGRRALESLLRDADVLVENFRPGVLDKLGFGVDAVAKINPRVIYASVSGFGEDGPYEKRRAFDPVVQALSGIADVQTDPATGKAALVRMSVCDKVTALTFCQAITAALFARERSGKGERVTVNMLEAALQFCWHDSMQNQTFIGEFQRGHEVGHNLRVYETTESGYALGVATDPDYANLWRVLGREDLVDDPRVITMRARAENAAFMREQVEKGMAQLDDATLEAGLNKYDLAYARLNTRQSVIEDPQVVFRKSLPESDHPRAGRLRQPRPGADFAGAPTAITRHAPALGEHSEELLREAGFDQPEIDALKAQGTIIQG